jgi:hypothetical protein
VQQTCSIAVLEKFSSKDASNNQASDLQGAHDISKVGINAPPNADPKRPCREIFGFLAEKLEQEKMDKRQSPKEPQKRQRASPDVLTKTLQADGLAAGETPRYEKIVQSQQHLLC